MDTTARGFILLTLSTLLLLIPCAHASTVGDPFAPSALTLGPADDPAADPTPADRDTEASYNGSDLVLANAAVQGDVTGLALTAEGCDPGLLDTGTEGFVLADVDGDSLISAPDLVQDDEAHGLNVNSAGNALVFHPVSGTWLENASWALSLYLERGPKCTGYDTANGASGTPPPMPALTRAWGTLADVSAISDVVEADLLFSESMSGAYRDNPELGELPAGVIGYHLTFDVSTLAGTLSPLSGECGNDVQCDDGLACNGAETCDLGTRTCQLGTAPDCSDLTSQCGVGVCAEPVGCTVDPWPDGTPCEDGSICTTGDACLQGVCTGTEGADTDGDSYCDDHELLFGCDAYDPAVIPLQPAVYTGSRIAKTGEVLLTFAVPQGRDVVVPLDPSCATEGVCGTGGRCDTGKIGDPCLVDSDCNQPAYTCRVIMNYAMVLDMSLVFAKMRGLPPPPSDLSADVLPLAFGCSRKMDFAIPGLPAKKRANLVIKVDGTMDGRRRRDRDRIRFLRQCPRNTTYIPACNP